MKNCLQKPYFVRAVLGIALLAILLAGCNRPRRHDASSDKSYDAVQITVMQDARPRIIVFSSIGGGGHTSATHALTSYLGGDYQIVPVHIFSDVLGKLDPFCMLSSGRWTGESIYNFFLAQGIVWGGGMWCSMGKWASGWWRHTLEFVIEEFLREQKPDAIISVVPVINTAIYHVAEKLKIPFAVITVDLDTGNYINGMHTPSYEHFYYAIPFEDQAIREALVPASIPVDKIRVVGFPVRDGFLRTYDKAAVRRAWHIPDDRPVAMVLMGAAGSRATLAYARALRKVKIPLHLVLCIGRNARLADLLRAIEFPEHITISIVGFTDKIHELMAASDFLITKPGPTTICEALAMRLPLILDHTGSPLYWEKMNIDFVVKHGFGRPIRSLRRLPRILEAFVQDESGRAAVAQAIAAYPWPDVRENVRTLVADMLTASGKIPSPIPDDLSLEIEEEQPQA